MKKKEKPKKVGDLLRNVVKNLKSLQYPIKIREPIYIPPELVSQRNKIFNSFLIFKRSLSKDKYVREYGEILSNLLYYNDKMYNQLRKNLNFKIINNLLDYKRKYEERIQKEIENERSLEEEEIKKEIEALIIKSKKKKNFFKNKIKDKNKSLDNQRNSILNYENLIKSQISLFKGNSKVPLCINKKINKSYVNNNNKNCKSISIESNKLKNSNLYISKSRNIIRKISEQKVPSFSNSLVSSTILSSSKKRPDSGDTGNKIKLNPNIFIRNYSIDLKRNKTKLKIENNKVDNKTIKRAKSAFHCKFNFSKFSIYKIKYEESLNREINKISDKKRVLDLIAKSDYFVKNHRYSLINQKSNKLNGLILQNKRAVSSRKRNPYKVKIKFF